MLYAQPQGGPAVIDQAFGTTFAVLGSMPGVELVSRAVKPVIGAAAVCSAGPYRSLTSNTATQSFTAPLPAAKYTVVTVFVPAASVGGTLVRTTNSGFRVGCNNSSGGIYYSVTNNGVAAGPQLIAAAVFDGAPWVAVTTYDGAAIRSWLQKIGDPSTRQSASGAAGYAAPSGTIDIGNGAATQGMVAVTVAPVALSNAVVLSLLENPWQLFLDQDEEDEAAFFAVGSANTGLALIGNATSVASGFGALSASAALTGSASAAAVGTGALTATLALTGSAVCGSSGTGAMTAALAVTGVALASSSATGALSASLALSGNASAQAGASAMMAAIAALSGTTTAQASASATLSASMALTGSATCGATASGALSASLALSGSAVAQASATGVMLAVDSMTGSATAQASGSGAMTATLAMTGAAVCGASAGGLLEGLAALTGHASASASASGSLTAGIALTGEGGVSVFAAGVLTAAMRLTGSAACVASGMGHLPGSVVYTRSPVGNGYSAPQRDGERRTPAIGGQARPAAAQGRTR